VQGIEMTHEVPDADLREMIQAAHKEWDMQAHMPDEEIERLTNVSFRGSGWSFDAYMSQRLVHHLSLILQAAEHSDNLTAPPGDPSSVLGAQDRGCGWTPPLSALRTILHRFESIAGAARWSYVLETELAAALAELGKMERE
jgi:hypothetical protein